LYNDELVSHFVWPYNTAPNKNSHRTNAKRRLGIKLNDEENKCTFIKCNIDATFSNQYDFFFFIYKWIHTILLGRGGSF